MHALVDSGGVLTSLLDGRVASELMMAKTVLLPSYMRVDVRQNAIDTALNRLLFRSLRDVKERGVLWSVRCLGLNDASSVPRD